MLHIQVLELRFFLPVCVLIPGNRLGCAENRFGVPFLEKGLRYEASFTRFSRVVAAGCFFRLARG